jgi:hypothetical protein
MVMTAGRSPRSNAFPRRHVGAAAWPVLVLVAAALLPLAGAADVPAQPPNKTRFELVINLKAVQALDLRIAPTLLMRADHTIDR